jgi:hypothetical protein
MSDYDLSVHALIHMPLTYAMSQPLLRKRLFPQAGAGTGVGVGALHSTLNRNAEALVAYNMLARVCSLPDGFSLYPKEPEHFGKGHPSERVNSLPASGASSTYPKKTHARAATTGLAPGHLKKDHGFASSSSASVLDIGVCSVASPQSIAFSPQLALLKAAFASTMIDWAGTERAGNASSSSSPSPPPTEDVSVAVAAATDASARQQDRESTPSTDAASSNTCVLCSLPIHAWNLLHACNTRCVYRIHTAQ